MATAGDAYATEDDAAQGAADGGTGYASDVRGPDGAAAAPHRPDLTREELDREWGERPADPDASSDDDERLLRERPPHWE